MEMEKTALVTASVTLSMKLVVDVPSFGMMERNPVSIVEGGGVLVGGGLGKAV